VGGKFELGIMGAMNVVGAVGLVTGTTVIVVYVVNMIFGLERLAVEPVSSNVVVLPPTIEDAMSETLLCDSKLAVELVPF
jgi:hypothetical protein